jgi:hypothetical protein
MSRIFALVATASILFIGAIAAGTAADNSGSTATGFNQTVEIVAAQLDVVSFVPFILAVGLAIGVLGVLARAT